MGQNGERHHEFAAYGFLPAWISMNVQPRVDVFSARTSPLKFIGVSTKLPLENRRRSCFCGFQCGADAMKRPAATSVAVMVTTLENAPASEPPWYATGQCLFFNVAGKKSLESNNRKTSAGCE